VIAIATNALCIGGGSEIKFKVSDETTLQMVDNPVGQLSTTGTPNVVSAPTRSLYQTDVTAIRLIADVSWALRSPSGIAWLINNWAPPP
jgi:hypothetical protein